MQNTRQRSQSHSSTAAVVHSEPRLTAAQWSADLTTSLSTLRLSPLHSPSLVPAAAIAHQHFYHPIRHMPCPGERSAPTFDGSPRSLKWFLEEIELLGRERHVNSQEYIMHALRYLKPCDREIWEGLALATDTAGCWRRFKNKIIALYPGSIRRYTALELEILVEHQAAVPMIDLAQYGEYLRQFDTRANWLVAHNKISELDRAKLFLQGFHLDFRQQMKMQLRLMDPMHPFDEPWSVTEIEKAARFSLPSIPRPVTIAYPTIASPGVQPSYSTYIHPLPQPPIPLYAEPTQVAQPALPTQSLHPSHSTPATSADNESFEASVRKEFLALADAVIDGLNSKVEQNTVASYTQQTQSSRIQYQSGCQACSDPNHSIKFCSKVVEYVRQGRCTKDQSNRICLPSGIFVSANLAPGKDILERVDNWHKSHPTGTVKLN